MGPASLQGRYNDGMGATQRRCHGFAAAGRMDWTRRFIWMSILSTLTIAKQRPRFSETVPWIQQDTNSAKCHCARQTSQFPNRLKRPHFPIRIGS
jgi:hypothetical protein